MHCLEYTVAEKQIADGELRQLTGQGCVNER